MTESVYISVFNRDSSSDVQYRLFDALENLDYEGEYEINYEHGQPVDANRNEAVKDFLDSDKDKFLMIDNDVVPPENILDLAQRDLDVVSGLVTINQDEFPLPLVIKKNENGYVKADPLEYIYSDTDFINVDATGTGCVMIDREVLESLQSPWFEFDHNEYGGMGRGEDFVFSSNAIEQGYDIFVSTKHVCRHYKNTDLSNYALNIIERDMKIKKLKQILEREGIDIPEHL